MAPTPAKTPRVSGGRLQLGGESEPIAVGSPAWHVWLDADATRSFVYETAEERLSARRERQRNSRYWYAYRRVGGRLRKVYLGRAQDLGREQLDAALVALGTAPAAPESHQAATQPDAPLWTKLVTPIARSGAIERRRLTDRLAGDAPLTLVSAPAGFGKTTIIASWLARRVPAPYAWVSLDADDSEPSRFWRAAFAALDRAHPGVWLDAQTYAQQHAPTAEIGAAIVARGCAACAAPVTLVLDDYHLIGDEAIHAAFGRLLDQPPPNMRLVLITRVDPPLPLARLRARGQLVELRAADLRFTQAETAAFLGDTMRLAVPPAAIAALDARTEGWAAGLQLAALALRALDLRDDDAQRQTTLDAWIDEFSGNHRAVADYLASEALDRQPADVQEFLLRTAVLDQLSADLCAALYDAPGIDAQAMIERIERANLFLTPLDAERRLYRYHHLFADMLRERLLRHSPALATELHRRAAAWHRGQGHWRGAIHHGFAAGDLELVIDDIEAGADQMIWEHADIQIVARWIERLPHAMVKRCPALLLNAAWASLAALHREPTERLLHAALDAMEATDTGDNLAAQEALRGEVMGLRAFLLRIDGDIEAALELSAQALERIPPQRAIVRSLIVNNIHNAYCTTGDVARLAELHRQHDIGTAAHDGISGMNRISIHHSLLIEQGRLAEAEALIREVLAARQRSRGAGYGPADTQGIWFRFGGAESALAWSAYEHDRLDEAESFARRAIELGREWWNNDILLQGHFALHAILVARGQPAAARQCEDTILQLARAYRFVYINWQFRAVRAAFALERGDLDEALAWERGCGLLPDDSIRPAAFNEYHTLARILAASGRAALALPIATRLLALAESSASVPRRIQALLLCATICAALDRQTAARGHVGDAVALGIPGGYIRTFLQHGEPIHRLLAVVAARPDEIGAYARLLLRAIEAVRPDALLSPRETEILHQLASGKTARQIAAALIIATTTVQTHIKHIYRKLEAANRTQALESARAHGLLEL